MLQFYEKRSWRIILRSWWFVGMLALVCLFLLYIVYDRYIIERDMAQRRHEAELKLQALQDRKTAIEDRVEYLGSERGIEAEMRRNFDVAQPGEQVVIILDPEEETSTIEPLAIPPTEAPPWYIFWR